MKIFYRCSFRASHGFKNGMYDTVSKSLIFLSEKDKENNPVLPKAVQYTLSHQFGRSLLLAADENKHLFFGVYELIEGDDDKYVNAVFTDPDDQKRIIAMYRLFCAKPQESIDILIDSVYRGTPQEYAKSGLEFKIDHKQILSLIKLSADYITDKGSKSPRPYSILSYITEDTFDSHRNMITPRFTGKGIMLIENHVTNQPVIDKRFSSESECAFFRCIKYIWDFIITTISTIGKLLKKD